MNSWHVQLVMRDKAFSGAPFIHHCFVQAENKQAALRAARAKAKGEYADCPGIEYIRCNSIGPDDGCIIL